ncbi:MAG TPA: hypothetical protein ENN56_04710 [Firmicutes bacterium]|nr:hypothetical protein [Bacillota bacterium]
MKRTHEPCPAGIEDRCPIPRYRCREFGEPGKHCFELFAEFEAFVLPSDEPDTDDDTSRSEIDMAVLQQLRAQGISDEEIES